MGVGLVYGHTPSGSWWTGLMIFREDGNIYGTAGAAIQPWEANLWYGVKMRVDIDDGTAEYWIDGTYRGIQSNPGLPLHQPYSHLLLGSGGGKGWVDEVKLYATPGLEVEACITDQWGCNFAPWIIFGQEAQIGEIKRAYLQPTDPDGNPAGANRYFRDFLPDSSDYTWRTHPSGDRWELNTSFISRLLYDGDEVPVYIQFAGAACGYPGCVGYIKSTNPEWRISEVFYPYIDDCHSAFGWRLDGDSLLAWEGRACCPGCALRENPLRCIVVFTRGSVAQKISEDELSANRLDPSGSFSISESMTLLSLQMEGEVGTRISNALHQLGAISMNENKPLDIEACITDQWGSNSAPWIIFGKETQVGQCKQAYLQPTDPDGNPARANRYFRDFLPDSSDYTWRTHPSGDRWELNTSFISRLLYDGDEVPVYIQFAGATGAYPGCAGYIKATNPEWRIGGVSHPYIDNCHSGFGWRLEGDSLMAWEGRGCCPGCALRENPLRFIVVFEKKTCDITVTSPNGGVVLCVGDTWEITWTSCNTSGKVTIEYSTDCGETWQLLLLYTDDDGSYIRPVPDTPSDCCLVRICDYENPTCCDVSDTFFTVDCDCDPPDLVQPTDFEGCAGDVGTTEIKIYQNQNPIDAFGLELSYDTSMLDFVGAEEGDLTQGWDFFEAIEITPGVIRVGGFNTEAIHEDTTGSIAKVTFEVLCTECDDGLQSQLCLQNLKDDLAGWNTCCDTFTCKRCEPGDLNCDGEITPGDALCAFWCYLLGECPADCQVEGCECCCDAGEVNCDGEVTPGDALCIFWRYLIEEWPPECECGPVAKGSQEAKEPFAVSLGEVVGDPGDLVKFPLSVDNPQGLSAFGASLIYPAHLLDFVEVVKTTATNDWIALNGSENSPGVITLGGFHTEAINTHGSAPIAEVIFRVKDGASGWGELSLSRLLDDFAGAATAKGFFSTEQRLASTYVLAQNFPNPFNPVTSIQYSVISDQSPPHVTLKIYNLLGQEVRTLVDEGQRAGFYTVTWDGKDNNGREMASGVYIYRIEAGSFLGAKKMMLVR
ncbi:MAG: cohesin domain-containing protein [bacterium]